MRRNCGGFYRVSIIWDFFSRRGCDARELGDVGVVLSRSCCANLVAACTAEARYAILGTRIALLPLSRSNRVRRLFQPRRLHRFDRRVADRHRGPCRPDVVVCRALRCAHGTGLRSAARTSQSDTRAATGQHDRLDSQRSFCCWFGSVHRAFPGLALVSHCRVRRRLLYL